VGLATRLGYSQTANHPSSPTTPPLDFLRFEDSEINELLDLEYGKKRTFAVLATLYPGLDLTKSHHVDHIFPRSRFYRNRLAQAGVAADQIEDFASNCHGIANLQLLPGTANIEKQAMLPTEWLNGPHFTSPEKRTQYVHDNDLESVPKTILGFLEFYEMRRQKLQERLETVLGL
jgi:hypothetical protein